MKAANVNHCFTGVGPEEGRLDKSLFLHSSIDRFVIIMEPSPSYKHKVCPGLETLLLYRRVSTSGGRSTPSKNTSEKFSAN